MARVKAAAYLICGAALVMLASRWLDAENILANGLLFLMGSFLGYYGSQALRRWAGVSPEETLSWARCAELMAELFECYLPAYFCSSFPLQMALGALLGFALGGGIVALAVSVRTLAGALTGGG